MKSNFESLKFWNFETLRRWNLETLKVWHSENLKLWCFETFLFSMKGIPTTRQPSDAQPCTQPPSWGHGRRIRCGMVAKSFPSHRFFKNSMRLAVLLWRPGQIIGANGAERIPSRKRSKFRKWDLRGLGFHSSRPAHILSIFAVVAEGFNFPNLDLRVCSQLS